MTKALPSRQKKSSDKIRVLVKKERLETAYHWKKRKLKEKAAEKK